MPSQKSIVNLIRVVEIIVAALIAYFFRFVLDWLLSPLALGDWIILIRWFGLILLIAAALRIHPRMVNYFKKKNIVPQDFTW